MSSKAKFLTATTDSTVKAAIEPNPAKTSLWHGKATKGRAEEGRGQLLLRVESGEPLSLAEYVRAEEMLAHSVCAGGVRL
jgi:hypothetical protein